MKKQKEMPIFVKWFEFLKWLFPITAKFPQRSRFTFANRIDNIALDVMENIIEARYTKNRNDILKEANLRIEKMRILMRLCKELGLLSFNSYEFANKSINEVGKMIGGWIKSGHVNYETI